MTFLSVPTRRFLGCHDTIMSAVAYVLLLSSCFFTPASPQTIIPDPHIQYIPKIKAWQDPPTNTRWFHIPLTLLRCSNSTPAPLCGLRWTSKALSKSNVSGDYKVERFFCPLSLQLSHPLLLYKQSRFATWSIFNAAFGNPSVTMNLSTFSPSKHTGTSCIRK